MPGIEKEKPMGWIGWLIFGLAITLMALGCVLGLITAQSKEDDDDD